MYTNQKQIRKAFKNEFPELDFKKTPSYDGKMYKTDTRCAFNDYIDHLRSNGEISEKLAERATL